MRGICIRYEYDGDEEAWLAACQEFIAALNADDGAKGFAYQVAIGDDGKSRMHWGRWDSQDTLERMQAQPYFTTFVAKVREFAGGAPETFAANVMTRTGNW